MTDNWYCRFDGQEFGPMPFEELTARLERRTLQPDDAMRFGAGGVWMPAVDFALGDEVGESEQESESAEERAALDIDFDRAMGELTTETSDDVPERSDAYEPPAPSAADVTASQTNAAADVRSPVRSRRRSLTMIVSAAAASLVALLGLLQLGRSSRRQTIDQLAVVACDRIDGLYRELDQARAADLDGEQWRRTLNEIHERRREIQLGVYAAPPDSAAHDVARAARMLETMTELPRDTDAASSNAGVAYHAAERRLQEALERARRKLSGD